MEKNIQILHKEIDLIQSCINRMAQNSFIIKRWVISLIAIILTLLPQKFNINSLLYTTLAITFCFWYLDAFFLKMERLYRWKYEWVINMRETIDEFYYDLNPYNINMWMPQKNNIPKEAPCIICVMLSKTLIPLYGILIVLQLILLKIQNI